MARRMKGSSRGSDGAGKASLTDSLNQLFGGLAKLGLLLAMFLFTVWLIQAKTIEQYMSIRNITLHNATGYFTGDGETDASTEIASINSGFDTVKDLLTFLLGLLSLIGLVLVFGGYIIPVLGRIFG